MTTQALQSLLMEVSIPFDFSASRLAFELSTQDKFLLIEQAFIPLELSAQAKFLLIEQALKLTSQGVRKYKPLLQQRPKYVEPETKNQPGAVQNAERFTQKGYVHLQYNNIRAAHRSFDKALAIAKKNNFMHRKPLVLADIVVGKATTYANIRAAEAEDQRSAKDTTHCLYTMYLRWKNNFFQSQYWMYTCNTFGLNTITKRYKIEGNVVAGLLAKKKKQVVEAVIPTGVKAIAGYVFFYCGRLTSLTLPDTLTSIGDSAFFCCRSLRHITFPDSLISIGDQAFYGCKQLSAIEFPDKLKFIGNAAFKNCGLKNISLPEFVHIGECAFSTNELLHTVTIRPIATRPFIVWAVGNSRHRANWQLNTIKYYRNLLGLITSFVWEDRRDFNTVDPGGVNGIFENCVSLINLDGVDYYRAYSRDYSADGPIYIQNIKFYYDN